jgi:hypothetical protein
VEFCKIIAELKNSAAVRRNALFVHLSLKKLLRGKDIGKNLLVA